ncbi:MAG: LysR family transcriptional regulator [Hyphomicrobiaceae bacterium]
MLDRFTSMQVFARVAALGSLSGAARALGMSQTMATKHVAALEARLSTKLLHRTTRRMTLTEAGRSYLTAVERILSDIDEAEASASRESVDVRGTLRLNAPVSFGIRAIAPLLPDFSRLFPDLTVDLGLNDRYVDLIEEGWDLVIRIGGMQDSTMIARRLAPCPMVVCAAPSYLEAHGTPRTVADLQHHNCLRYTLSRSIGTERWPFGVDRRVTVTVSGSLKANNGDVLVAAAVAGEGVVYQPSFLVARELEQGLLVPLSFDHRPIELDGVFAVYPSDRHPPAKVRVAIDFFAERLPLLPPLQGATPASPSQATVASA